MKIKSNGGEPALRQAFLNLQKFTAHLDIVVRPFIFETSEINFSTRLFVNNKGQLKAIQKAKLN
jgi:hypothetical protein